MREHEGGHSGRRRGNEAQMRDGRAAQAARAAAGAQPDGAHPAPAAPQRLYGGLRSRALPRGGDRRGLRRRERPGAEAVLPPGGRAARHGGRREKLRGFYRKRRFSPDLRRRGLRLRALRAVAAAPRERRGGDDRAASRGRPAALRSGRNGRRGLGARLCRKARLAGRRERSGEHGYLRALAAGHGLRAGGKSL